MEGGVGIDAGVDTCVGVGVGKETGVGVEVGDSVGVETGVGVASPVSIVGLARDSAVGVLVALSPALVAQLSTVGEAAGPRSQAATNTAAASNASNIAHPNVRLRGIRKRPIALPERLA